MAATELPELPDRYNRPGAPRANRGAPRVAALDGLRGIAIAAVVAFHAGVLPGGFLGVDLFFVLSGFLITSLLFREHTEQGAVGLREFWTRRARRLVPAVIVLVAAAQLWARTRASLSELPVLNGQSVAAMLYASNWYNVLFDVGYWSVGPSHSPLNHLWSLAIEEQFYLFFPLLFVAWFNRSGILNASRLQRFGVLCLVLASVSFALMATLFSTTGGNRAYFGTDTRIGAILVGCALSALLRARSVGATAQNSPNTRLGLLAAVVAVVVMFALWLAARTASPWLYRGGFVLHAVASAAVVAAIATDASGWASRVLQWRPVVWLGERSYSLYVWHWPLMVVLTPATTGLDGAVRIAVVSIAIVVATIVSYELIEHPIRYSRLRGVRLISALAIPAALVALSALIRQPEPPPQFGNQALITQGRGGIRLMLVGDSWARNLGIALAAVDSTHHMSILNMGKGGCGIADAMRERSAEKGEFATPPDCKTWSSAWTSTINIINPEVAILNVGNWDQAAQDFDGTGEFVGACHALFRERYARQLDKAVSILRSRRARVFIMTIRDNDARAGSSPDCMNTLLREAAARHASNSVSLLDLYAQLCAEHICPNTVDGEQVYDATGHLAPRAQRRIATWVLNSVNAAVSSGLTVDTARN